MATQTFTFSPGTGILTPVEMPQDARQDAAQFGPSLTITRGQALARKTSDNLLYALNTGASDGTQTFVGFAAYSFKTDASSKVFFVTGSDAAAASVFAMPNSTAAIYTGGTFDPQDLTTKGTPVAELDTFTPGGTITTGDVNTITYTAPDTTATAISFTVGATATAAAVVTGLIAAWNANATLAALGTAGGTSTFTVTGLTSGNALNLASAVTGVGTLTKAVTTAASGRAIADILGGAPGARVLHNGYWKVA
jgi:hypothetical protein